MSNNIKLSPLKLNLNEFNYSKNHNNKQLHIIDKLEGGGILDAFLIPKEGAKKMVVLLPSAQPANSVNVPVFHRWSWAYQFEQEHVISLSDPALYEAEINAAWFLSKKYSSYISKLGKFVSHLANSLNIDESNIVLYGSSMGGFGALMVASRLQGAIAIAEVPQLDLTKYPIKNAIDNIHTSIFDGEKVVNTAEYNKYVNVLSAFKDRSYVPPIHLLTNLMDDEYIEHVNFLAQLKGKELQFERRGNVDITVLSENLGHKPMPTPSAVKIIKSVLSRGWEVARYTLNHSENSANKSEITYKEILDSALEVAESVNYTRTDSDESNYKLAIDLLRKASELNKYADWPLLKICSMTKLWTNSFNLDIFSAAQEALARKVSLEGFIYYCKGALFNFDIDEAISKIDLLIERIDDSQIRNVGNIFKGLCLYEKGDFLGYEKHIELFLSTKESSFSPYIAIPVSTVYTSGSQDKKQLDLRKSDIEFLSSIERINASQAKYIISISCDEVYFKKYAAFILESFSMTCMKESAIVITILNSSKESVSEYIEKLKLINVYISFVDINVGDNKGPTASLLRFLKVDTLLERCKLPVLVLDLDTVIKKPLLKFIEDNRSFDICSRILGGKVAPWEKYTGGFALFNPSTRGIDIAKNISKTAHFIWQTGEPQWWIDQNCFEAGIRLSLKKEESVKISNVIGIRDDYCIMPVGNEVAKLHCLTAGLDSVKVSYS